MMSKKDRLIKRLRKLPRDKQEEILSTLSPEERKVLAMRYGLPLADSPEQRKLDQEVDKTKPS